MSIDAGGQVVIILFAIGPCMVILNYLGQVLYLGRAPRTKETLPDFREWCRVTRHPRVFHGLTVCQRTPRERGVTSPLWSSYFEPSSLFWAQLESTHDEASRLGRLRRGSA